MNAPRDSIYEPDHHLFGRRVLVELESALPGRKKRYRRAGFRINVDGLPGGMNLHNAFREYCAAPDARRGEVLRKWIQAVCDLVDIDANAFGTLAEERTNLVPVIRRRYEFDAAARKAERGDPGSRQSGAHVARHFAVTLAVDRPRVYANVFDRSLASWGISFEAGLILAIENIKSRGPGMWERPSSGLFVSAWEDDNHAGRVLIPGVFEGPPATGDKIVCIPRRGCVIVADSAEAGALRELGEMAMQEWSTGAWPLSPMPLRLSPGKLEPYLPPEGHPSRAMYERMHREAVAQDYAAQKEDLRPSVFGEDQCPGFAASYMRVGSGVHADRSFTALTKGVVTTLPEADLVVLQEFAGCMDLPDVVVLGVVEFQRLRAVMGRNLVPQGLYPERWLAAEFPSDEDVRAMEPYPPSVLDTHECVRSVPTSGLGGAA